MVNDLKKKFFDLLFYFNQFFKFLLYYSKNFKSKIMPLFYLVHPYYYFDKIIYFYFSSIDLNLI
jgi:hypothetical protein